MHSWRSLSRRLTFSSSSWVCFSSLCCSHLCLHHLLAQSASLKLGTYLGFQLLSLGAKKLVVIQVGKDRLLSVGGPMTLEIGLASLSERDVPGTSNALLDSRQVCGWAFLVWIHVLREVCISATQDLSRLGQVLTKVFGLYEEKYWML
jgi:hypothetical protein